MTVFAYGWPDPARFRVDDIVEEKPCLDVVFYDMPTLTRLEKLTLLLEVLQYALNDPAMTEGDRDE